MTFSHAQCSHPATSRDRSLCRKAASADFMTPATVNDCCKMPEGQHMRGCPTKDRIKLGDSTTAGDYVTALRKSKVNPRIGDRKKHACGPDCIATQSLAENTAAFYAKAAK